MAEEIVALKLNNTWIVQLIPTSKKTKGCIWIYKVKYHANGLIDRYKTYLVAQGFTSQARINFLDTFSPVENLKVMKDSTIRPYVYATTKGLSNLGREHGFHILNIPLYRLKQTLSSNLAQLGFTDHYSTQDLVSACLSF
ncbi:putative mitochondrial protein, partial [Mucuna pruriens]